METPGAYLKSKREALNISLQEISQVTRIRRSILEAIENNRYDLLPPKVFAQGFIKNYASYLGLDESEVIKRYSELVDVPETDATATEVRTPPSFARLFFIIVVVAGLLLAGAFLLWKNFQEKKTADMMPQQADPAASRVLTTPPPDEGSGDEAGREAAEVPESSLSIIQTDAGSPTAMMVGQQPPETAGQQPPGTDEQNPPAAAVDPPLTAIVEQKPAVATAGRQPADAAAGPLVLKIVASQNTWMRIQSDREPPVEFTLRGGEMRSVNAAEKFTIRIGNAGGADLFLNGQELGRPGKPGEVLDLTLPE